MNSEKVQSKASHSLSQSTPRTAYYLPKDQSQRDNLPLAGQGRCPTRPSQSWLSIIISSKLWYNKIDEAQPLLTSYLSIRHTQETELPIWFGFCSSLVLSRISASTNKPVPGTPYYRRASINQPIPSPSGKHQSTPTKHLKRSALINLPTYPITQPTYLSLYYLPLSLYT